jgi:hypothetical protein
MPRPLKLKTLEMGEIDILAIYRVAGKLEWDIPEDILEDLPQVSSDLWNKALSGWTRPLVDVIGREPRGCLKKFPTKECGKRGGCPFYDRKQCRLEHPKMPWCFVPAGYETTTPLVSAWRDGRYVVIVDYIEEV